MLNGSDGAVIPTRIQSGHDTIIYPGQQVSMHDMRQRIHLPVSATATLELLPRDQLAAGPLLASTQMNLNTANSNLEIVADRLGHYANARILD